MPPILESATLLDRPPTPPTCPAGRSPPVGRGAAVRRWCCVALLLVAANLRAAVTSLGAVLDEVRDGLGLSPVGVGLLTTLPTLAFAAVGAMTPRLSRRLRPGAPARDLSRPARRRPGGARPVTASVPVFLVTTALALAGIAVANILLPRWSGSTSRTGSGR